MTACRLFFFLRIVALTALVGALGACSSVKLFYGFADSALVDRAERYLMMDAAEEARIEAEIAALVQWHRTQMLPRYATFLDACADVTERGAWRSGDVATAFSGFRKILDETARGAAPFLARVLVGHTTTERVAHLEARMAAYIAEEIDEENEPQDELLEERLERRVNNFERFTGPLRDDQVAIIERHTRPALGERVRWLDHLGRRHDALAAFLRSRPETDALGVFVHRLMMRGWEIVEPGYAHISEARWRKLEAMYTDVLASLDKTQRLTLVQTLRNYAQDMRDLAAGV